MKSQLSILPTKKMTLKKLEGGVNMTPPQSVRVKIGWKNFVMKAKVGKEDKGWRKRVIKKPKFLASGTNSTVLHTTQAPRIKVLRKRGNV